MFNQSPPQSSIAKVLSGIAFIAPIGIMVAAPQSVSAMSLTPVRTELSLLVDVSTSIRANEYDLQMGAYGKAFRNLAASFETGEFGSVAVNLIQWSSDDRQQESIGWTLINDRDSALEFANAIDAIDRPFGGGTAPGSAIEFAIPSFSNNDYEGQRWVIDVSGDGVRREGISTQVARDNALAAGVSAINGLPILVDPDEPFLEQWYEDNIQGGKDSFTIAANGFDDMERAVEQKLRRELEIVPTPANFLGVLITGGLAQLKRRRQAEET